MDVIGNTLTVVIFTCLTPSRLLGGEESPHQWRDCALPLEGYAAS